MVLGTLVFLSASIGYAQTESTAAGSTRTDLMQVPAGQKMNVDGVIVNQGTDSLTVRGTGGGLYKVLVAGRGNKREEKQSLPGRKELFESGPPARIVYRGQGIRRQLGIDSRP